MDRLSKYILIGVIILLIVLIFSIYRGCNLYDQNSVIKGENNALRAETKKVHKEKDAIIARELETIRKQDEVINKSEAKIRKLEEKDALKLRTIEGLEAEREGLVNKDAIINNLTKQVETWKERFSLAEERIIEKNRVIFALNIKYNSAMSTANSYKAKLSAEQKLRLSDDQLIKSLERSLRFKRTESTIEKIAIGGLLAYVGYKTLKGN